MRIRTVKPEFWSNPDLAALPDFTRLLALGLLNFADDEGFFWSEPAIIRGSLFPFSNGSGDVQKAIGELVNVGYVRLFTGKNGRTYGQVTNFKKHQRINRPSESKIATLIDFSEPSVSAQTSLKLSSNDPPPKPADPESGKMVNVVDNELQGPFSLLGTGNREQGTGNMNPILGGSGLPKKTELQRRAESLFNRREKTPWSKIETEAWKRSASIVADTTEQEWVWLERYYALPDPPPPARPFYRRKALDTLLNHWAAEVALAANHMRAVEELQRASMPANLR